MGRVADRDPAGFVHVVGGVAFGDEVPIGDGVVGSPGVPHRRREVEQVAGMDGGRRDDLADEGERRLVPDAGDRVIGRFDRAVVDGVVGPVIGAAPDERARHHHRADQRRSDHRMSG